MKNTDFVTGFNSKIEEAYDYGVLGGKNTYVLDLDTVVNSDEVPVVDEETGNNLDTKIIYAHPSQLPMQHGTQASSSYSGKGVKGYRIRDVNDSAVLMVHEDPPFQVENIDFDGINSFLIGDQRDTFLEGESIRLQAYPF
ncbi:MAG: hypothetical protein V5A72_00360, partial [Candidatus Nanohaloarchaea archaeon]